MNNTRYETQTIAPKQGSQATKLLILVCIIMYPIGLRYNGLLAYSYSHLVYRHQWWTLGTALFVHGGLGHLLGNMLFLFLFGRSLENIIGPARLLLVFFAGGVLSLLASHVFYDADVPIVGASGSICTILGLLMIYSPWKISFLLNFFPMPLGVAALTYMIMNYVLAQRNYSGNSPHTAYELHIMGFIVGILFGVAWVPDWKRNLIISILSFIVFYVILFLVIFHYRWRFYY